MRAIIRNSIATAALAALLAGPFGNYAMPTGLAPLHRRGYQGVASLIDAVIDYLKDVDAYATSVPDKCNVLMRTTAGANCEIVVTCYGETNGESLPANDACYLNGRQYATHPKLGDFSVTYSKAGGVDGNKEDGLHNPILQMKNLNNWEPIDVQKILDDQSSLDAGKLCSKASIAGTQRKDFTCALPVVGTAGFGMSNFPPVDANPGYAAGWCTMHVVQHQRNENGVGADYEFDVVIKDNDGTEIGKVQLAAIDATTKSLSVSSHLPYTVGVTAAGDDKAPVKFSYGDQTWENSDDAHQSNFGDGPNHGFENGNREGDMGFTC